VEKGLLTRTALAPDERTKAVLNLWDFLAGGFCWSSGFSSTGCLSEDDRSLPSRHGGARMDKLSPSDEPSVSLYDSEKQAPEASLKKKATAFKY
jgi:hypothetical protein